MAITESCELAEGRTAQIAFASGSGVKSRYTRRFMVTVDAGPIDVRTLLYAPPAGVPAVGPQPLPLIGDSYPTDKGSVCVSLSAEPTDNHTKYLVVAQYDNPPASGFGTNPSDLNWEVSCDSIAEDFVADYDYGTHGTDGGFNDPALNYLTGALAGRPIRNTADDEFDPPLQDQRFLRAYNLAKFVDTWDEAVARERVGKINTTAFNFLGITFPAYSLYCSKWNTTGKQVFDGGEFYRLEAQLIYRPDFETFGGNVQGWCRAVVNRGYNQIKDDGMGNPEKRAIIMPGDDVKASEPQLLDVNGLRVADSNYDPLMLQFRTKRAIDMSTWQLPISFDGSTAAPIIPIIP